MIDVSSIDVGGAMYLSGTKKLFLAAGLMGKNHALITPLAALMEVPVRG